MEQQTITTINGIEIVTVSMDGDIFVPIKPICQALGIADNKQREKIKEDEILNTVGTLRVSTGADGKAYEMFCLPLRYVYGWLFTINPKNVSPDAREAVSRYRRECYDVLYEHFSRSLRRTIETNNAEIEALKAVNNAILRVKEAKAVQREAEERLDAIRKSRLDPRPELPL